MPAFITMPLSLAALDWLWIGLRAGLMLFGLLLVVGTLLSLTRLPWWSARMWDFPRVQIALFALICGIGAAALAAIHGDVEWYDWTFLALMLAVAAWQAWRIREYTPAASLEVQRGTGRLGDANVIRLVISNVLESNRQFDRWRRVMLAEDPDVVVAAEVTPEWVSEIGKAFDESHPNRVAQPQSNFYGMALWSRLPLRDAQVEFLVQADVPSIHGTLELRDGSAVCIHSLHPRPPAPQEDDSSAPRDAELVLMGKRIRREREEGHTEPTLVVGDLNDVAWSRTNDLFQKLSGLLDPRRGRGFYNTFSADSRFWRFPLDHVFISREFRLLDLRVLDHVGSDHFPVSITISLEPEKQADQAVLEPDARDERDAHEAIETQVEREQTGEEKGHLSQSTPSASPNL